MFWDARLENQAFRNSLLQCYFACACCCMPSNGSSSLARHQQDFHLLKIFFALWNFALLGRENDSLVPCHCHGDFLICGAGCRPGTAKLNQACRQNFSTSVAQEVLQSVRRSRTKMEDCEVGEGVTLSICRSNPLSKPPQSYNATTAALPREHAHVEGGEVHPQSLHAATARRRPHQNNETKGPK